MALPAYRVAHTLSGNSAFVQELTTTASTGSSVAGEFVVMAAAGTVTRVADNGAAVTGLALKTAGAGEKIPVVFASPDVIFSANLAAGTWNDNMVGALWDYNQAGLDVGTSGQDIFLAHGTDSTDSGRYLVSVNSAKTLGVPANVTEV